VVVPSGPHPDLILRHSGLAFGFVKAVFDPIPLPLDVEVALPVGGVGEVGQAVFEVAGFILSGDEPTVLAGTAFPALFPHPDSGAEFSFRALAAAEDLVLFCKILFYEVAHFDEAGFVFFFVELEPVGGFGSLADGFGGEFHCRLAGPNFEVFAHVGDEFFAAIFEGVEEFVVVSMECVDGKGGGRKEGLDRLSNEMECDLKISCVIQYRVRYFTDWAVIGLKNLVDKVFPNNRGRFGPNAKPEHEDPDRLSHSP